MKRLAIVPVLMFAGLVALVACQGGSSNLPPFNTGTTAPTFPPVPAFAVSTTEPFPAPVNGVSSVSLPPAQGFGGNLGFPFTTVPPGTTLTATFSSNTPSGVTPLGLRRVLDIPGHTTVLYLCITASGTLTTNGLPTFSFTAPPQYLASNVQWFLLQLVGGTWGGYAGPTEPVNGSVSFTGPSPLTFTANQPLCFGLIVELPGQPSPPTAVPTATPTPNPTPSATPPGQTPTPTPSPTPSATPPGQTPSPTPSPTPPGQTPTPTPTPSPVPTATPPGQTPTPTPTPTPVVTPTPQPTATPTPTPVVTPTPQPTATPTPQPTTTPTPQPTATPTPQPTATPTPQPTATPKPTATPTPTPTPVPTASPSPTPVPGALTAGPNPTNVVGVGAANAKAITVQETGYTGAFGEQDTCSGIATVSSSNAKGPTASYTVTGVAAGSCSATFADASNQTASVNITVTTNGFVINGARW